MSSHRAGQIAFFTFLAAMVTFYGVVLVYNQQNPDAFLTTDQIARAGMFERCRQFCLGYGLVPTGHLANDAKAFLREVKPEADAETLEQMLADAQFTPAASQASSLLGQRAPDFVLQNDRGESVALQDINARGPVVLVFYYGYWCNHCVAQLFGLDEELAKFQSLGAQIIAVSADPVEQTAERFAQYGRFNFPVLADPDYRVATNFGVYTLAGDGETGNLLHATFLIDRTGKVTWAQLGEQPWTDNKSLLVLLARQSAPALP